MNIDVNKYPVRRSNPIVKGSYGLPEDIQRYIVKGQGLIGIELEKGDKLFLKNLEGNQICEITIFDAMGNNNQNIINKKNDIEDSFLKKVLSTSSDKFFLIQKLKNKNINLNKFFSTLIFNESSKRDTSEEILVNENCFAVIACPGENMIIGNQNPPTDIEVIVKRINPKNNKLERILPEPLATPSEEILIKHSSANAYEIKKGDYIQIIDLYGRQCSDFMAFDSKALQHGEELSIDTTASRAIVGGAYAMPGLHSKYFDKNLEPLVEVVQDTIGRHDTFGTACTKKLYEDLGYFGHINCSDNFNYALDQYGVQKRNGWAAINLFFNTGIDANNVIYSDMPWSRAGDYVLFQAQKDLVCVSSGCPDDIDTANDWNPTDIYVRVYSEKNRFSKSIGYRKNAGSDFMLTKETGFHPRTSQLTNDMMDSSGFWIPNKFNNYGTIKEYTECRNNVVMMDLSSLRKFEVIGPDAEELLNVALTRNIKKLSIGQVVYTAMCYENGTMIDDGTLYKLGDHNFRWICGSDYSGEWLTKLSDELKLHVNIKSSTDHLHNISVQGPNSRKVISKIIWTPPAHPDVNNLEWFHFTISRIGDHTGIPIMLSRTGYTGELGYEIYCHPDDAPNVWDAIWEAGQEFNISPMGFEALDMLRIEAGLILGGHEFSDETDPFEAGISFTVPLKSKEQNFIGKEALIERKAHPHKKLVGLEIEGNEKVNHGDCVHLGRAQVGIITSGIISPTLNKNIALCRIDIRSSELGTALEIGKLDGHQKRIPAKVVSFPFYDPTKNRVRA
ncbi:aminomethyltransferase family protein [Alphaproteobacteria bacterium]|nr:aminomethyltransferase family protein [Alphaproteobacteria bacterium]